MMTHIERISEIKQQINSLMNELEQLEEDIQTSDSKTPEDSESSKKIQEVTQAVSCFLGLAPDMEEDTLLNMILRCAMHTVSAGGAGMTLYDLEKEKLVFKAAVGDGAENIIGYEIPLEGSQHGLAFATGEIQSSTPLHTGVEKTAKAAFKNVLVAPLFVEEEGIGTMSAVNKKDGDHFTSEDMKAYQLFSDLAALVVRQRLREETLKRLLLTGAASEMPQELDGLVFSKEGKQLLEIIEDVVKISRKQETLLPYCKKLTSLVLEMATRSKHF